jgi:hypothetical protein
MRKVLIISPYFPADNAADMHRVRMSLPYFSDYGWDAEVMAVHPAYTDAVKDPLLMQSLPLSLKIHLVAAWNKKITSKVGLGSIALRALWFYLKDVNRILKGHKYDVIYFSTTQFPVLILGAYWKWKYKTRIVIDVQDPWHTRYYKDKPTAERPKKFWFSYHLNRILEPIAMRAADGLISVSEGYLDTLKDRYSELTTRPSKVIPFGMHLLDLEIAIKNVAAAPSILPENGKKHIVYIGRGGYDLRPAMKLLFNALKYGLKENPEYFTSLQVYLIGTSYAATGTGKESFTTLINEFELQDMVFEQTDRIPFYATINTLRAADLLFIPGPDQPAYTASKLFPYIMAQKPILAIMHAQSNAIEILKHWNDAVILKYDQDELSSSIVHYVRKMSDSAQLLPLADFTVFADKSAKSYTRHQTKVFDAVCDNRIWKD